MAVFRLSESTYNHLILVAKLNLINGEISFEWNNTHTEALEVGEV